MTIREAGKGKVVGDSGMQTYRIGFNGGDETELNARNMSDLEQLWLLYQTERFTRLHRNDDETQTRTQ